MYKNLNKRKNEIQVNTIKDRFANLMEAFKSNPTIDAKEIKNKNNILQIVELILHFNQLDQAGKSLKMLRRLPISLAQLKAGNNSEKLKNEIRQMLYSLY